MRKLFLTVILLVSIGCEARVQVNSQDTVLKNAYDDGVAAGKHYFKTGKKLDNPFLHSMEDHSRSKETKWNEGFNKGIIESEGNK